MLEQIWEIIIYKDMGFELKEIKQLLQVSVEGQKEYLTLQIKISGAKTAAKRTDGAYFIHIEAWNAADSRWK